MWKLIQFEAYDSVNKRWNPDAKRTGWSGYILYDGAGHMGIHLMPKGYRDFDTNKNPDSLSNTQLKNLLNFYKSNYVYFADYYLSDSLINHKRLSATEPSIWGTVSTRAFQFKGDTLILTPVELIGGQQLRVKWIKL